MKATDKNIIMVTAGGIGARLGSSIPKQYIEINGRQVISYVIEACTKSTEASSGEELNVTKRNGIDYIRDHSACEKLVVVDAVRPTVDAKVLDSFFRRLDDYDAVACARKITDSLGRYGEWIVKREEYYTLSAPEGFRFVLIDKHFEADSPYTESIQQLPPTSKVYLDFDVPYFDKLTYPEDLIRLQILLSNR
jgi:2-C-methyl-D-erythritol 4-phosphate cytidylyltransferase